MGFPVIGTGAGVYVLPASLIAGAGEEGAEFRDVEDVDIAVGRVRGDVGAAPAWTATPPSGRAALPEEAG